MRRRMLLQETQNEKQPYIRQGIITIEEDFSSLDSNNIWDDFKMFNIGVTDAPENYGLIFYRINQSKPIVYNTISACYWVKSDVLADGIPAGNFAAENQRRITILSSTIAQRSFCDALMYLKDGWLRQLRFNTEWHYTKGDKYFWCIYEITENISDKNVSVN